MNLPYLAISMFAGVCLYPRMARDCRSTCQQPIDGRVRREKMALFGYDSTADYRAFNPSHRDRINEYKKELERLRQEVFAKAERGRKTPCSRQILVEAHWLIHYTADYNRIERRLKDLREMLA